MLDTAWSASKDFLTGHYAEVLAILYFLVAISLTFYFYRQFQKSVAKNQQPQDWGKARYLGFDYSAMRSAAFLGILYASFVGLIHSVRIGKWAVQPDIEWFGIQVWSNVELLGFLVFSVIGLGFFVSYLKGMNEPLKKIALKLSFFFTMVFGPSLLADKLTLVANVFEGIGRNIEYTQVRQEATALPVQTSQPEQQTTTPLVQPPQPEQRTTAPLVQPPQPEQQTTVQVDPKDKFAYNNHGLANNAKGDYDLAIADFSEAIRLDPKYALAYNNRCLARNNKGESDLALADCNEAIRLDPKYTSAYVNRGIVSLYAGLLPMALADFNQWSQLDPKNAYAALWSNIVGKRGNLPSRLAAAAKQIDMTKWPAPIVRLYLGQLTADVVLTAADDSAADTKRGQVCETNFFTGEFMLQSGKKDEAAHLFRLAAADCPKDFGQYSAANAELKALGMSLISAAR
jgi:lipoprotein NlpI